MFSFSSLKQSLEATSNVQLPVTDEALSKLITEFDDDERNGDPATVALNADSESSSSIIFIFRAVEVYSRDKQLQLFAAVTRIDDTFWDKAIDLFNNSVYRSSMMKLAGGALITAATEGALRAPERLYRLLRVILTKMVDYSISYHHQATQYISKLFNVHRSFSQLLTQEDLRKLFLFDYDCAEIDANERGVLRNIVNKQYSILEKLLSDELSEDKFYSMLVFSFKLFYSSALLRLDFLCTSISTALKRVSEDRLHINKLDLYLKKTGLKRIFSSSLQHTSAYRMLLSLLKTSLAEINFGVCIFDSNYLKFFLDNYLEWDTPFEYFIMLDQCWLDCKSFEFREDLVTDIIQKVKVDPDHKIRKHGKLLRLFCKFYSRYSKEKELDMKLKFANIDASLAYPEEENKKAVTSAFAYSALNLKPELISMLSLCERKCYSKSILSYDFRKSITSELEQEVPELAEAFGTKMHYHRLIAHGTYFPNSVMVAEESGSNNRFFGASVSKKGRYTLTTLYSRHALQQDMSRLQNTKTKKTILTFESINAYQHSLQSPMAAISTSVDLDHVDLVDMTRRKHMNFKLDSADLHGMPVVGLSSNFLIILNEEQNCLDLFAVDYNESAAHSRSTFISLWQYGKLRFASPVSYKKQSRLLLSFEGSNSLYFINLQKKTATKMKVDRELLPDITALHFDSKACRVLVVGNDLMGLFNVRQAFTR